jgi:glutamine synthetase
VTDLPPDAQTFETVLADSRVTHVMVGVVDLDGVLRVKLLAKRKLRSLLAGELRFCEVVLGFDSNDDTYENTRAIGWHTGFADQALRVGADAIWPWPGDPRTYLVLAEYAAPLDVICPRSLLGRIESRCAERGYRATAAFEYEFVLFDETPHSVRDKHFRDLRPITPGAFAYSALRSSVWRELYDEILTGCEALGVPLEGLHAESGPGVLEAAIEVGDPLQAADRAVLFKTFIKTLAQRRGLIASFMSRWSLDWPGQGGHIHLSLQDATGTAVFHDPDATDHISATMRQFVAGQQHLLPELCAMFAPTVNAYTRLAPGAWAPTRATWGLDNRTCALRVIPGVPGAQRVEHRVPGADANPYLALAAALGSGLWGLEHRLELADPTAGNAYEGDVDARTALPETLDEAASRLAGSIAARDLFGASFVEHFAATRRWEERQFRRAVTDWELRRYFEVI